MADERVTEGALDHYRQVGANLMADLAAINTQGGRHAYERRIALLEIDKILDRYNMLRLLEVGWMLALPEQESA